MRIGKKCALLIVHIMNAIMCDLAPCRGCVFMLWLRFCAVDGR